MKKVLLAGKVNHANYGDVLMLAFYANFARKANCEVAILEASDPVLREVQGYHPQAKSISLGEITPEYDICYFIGGGYFAHTRINGISWCRKWNEDGYFSQALSRLQSCRVPYKIMSVEVGPIWSNKTKRIASSIFNGALTAVVRNQASVDYAYNVLGVSRVARGPDMVFSELGAFADEHQLRLPLNKSRIGIHVTDKLIDRDYWQRRYSRTLESFIEKNNIDDVLLFSDNEETVDLDPAFDRLYTRFSSMGAKVSGYRFFALNELIKLISSAPLIVTTKLHVGVSALALGNTPICFSDNPKTQRFYSESDLIELYNPFYFSPFKMNLKSMSPYWLAPVHEKPTSPCVHSFYESEFLNNL